MRSPQFRNQLSQHSVPHTPEGSSALQVQVPFMPSIGLRPDAAGLDALLAHLREYTL